MSSSASKEIEANSVSHVNGLGDAEYGLDSTLSNDSNSDAQASDPWAIVELVDNSPKWSELTTSGKITRVLVSVAKFVSVLACLYFFICSLDLLSSSFRLIAGRTTGDIFSSGLLSNPVVGLMIGILVTVLVQSSSTATSIVVSMVGADIIQVPQAIPIIMGSNIGTSVTNTIVSFTQIGDRNEFRRAFAAATVHDMFNWLTVFVLFTLEIILRNTAGQGYLEFVSGEIVKGVDSSSGPGEIKILTVITEPFTQLIVQLNKSVLNEWAKPNNTAFDDASLIRLTCPYLNGTLNGDGDEIEYKGPCHFLFADTGMTDAAIGGILLAISLVMLCGCLVILVKILNSVMHGHVANLIKRLVNANIPYVPWLTGYLALFFGAVMTFIVQSSSVFTSTLTPLVGVGVITIERVYPLTLGSNIGTTTTSLLAALATDASKLSDTLQISLCHLFFNITGILLFYPVPFMRFPIPMAKFLGETTAKYRWFSIAYLVGMFLILPAAVFGISLGGDIAVYCVLGPIVVIVIFVVVVSVLQRKKPSALPAVLRTWKWLPEPMRSLAPLDRLITKLTCCGQCCKCCRGPENEALSEGSSSISGSSLNDKCTEKASDIPLEVVSHSGATQRVARGLDNPSYDE